MGANAARKILVVDDNEANRSLARATLEDEGYVVVEAEDGARGIAAFAAEEPDCVLLDVRMPDIDGLVACERIRALPRGPETPILFLTALRDVDTFDRAVRAGGDDYLTKPVRPTELVLRVQTALELGRVKSELRQTFDLLKRQRDDLLRLQLQKERLTAFVVHDLKNPVNTLDLHAQLLLRERGLPEGAKESAQQIRIEARQLTRMILNLLDVSKADEGQLVPKRGEVDLRALVDGVFSELDANAKGRQVELRSKVGALTVSADPDLLRRVLVNLVDNALRYSPPKTTITVSASAKGEDVELRVADQGGGIPEAMREKVFQPFVQVDAGERVVERTSRGLGLSFCRLAVEAHGGKIWVEDAKPGCAFVIRLPPTTSGPPSIAR